MPIGRRQYICGIMAELRKSHAADARMILAKRSAEYRASGNYAMADAWTRLSASLTSLRRTSIGSHDWAISAKMIARLSFSSSLRRMFANDLLLPHNRDSSRPTARQKRTQSYGNSSSETGELSPKSCRLSQARYAAENGHSAKAQKAKTSGRTQTNKIATTTQPIDVLQTLDGYRRYGGIHARKNR